MLTYIVVVVDAVGGRDPCYKVHREKYKYITRYRLATHVIRCFDWMEPFSYKGGCGLQVLKYLKD